TLPQHRAHTHTSLATNTRPPPTSPPFPYTTLFRSEYQVIVTRVFPGARPRIEMGDVSPSRLVSLLLFPCRGLVVEAFVRHGGPSDRKSTRVDSSHEMRSYAVFWLTDKRV